MNIRLALALPFLLVAMFVAMQVHAAQQEPAELSSKYPVRLLADPQVSALRIPPPVEFLRQEEGATTPKSTLTINYLPTGSGRFGDSCIEWPAQPKIAFTYAVNIWASQLESPVPITVDACWANNMETGVLGHAAALRSYANFPGALRPDTWYPAALANALRRMDMNTGESDVYTAFNSSFSWYVGTDGRPSSSQHDFATVVLHELGHGLGFSGSMSVSSGLGRWGSSGYPRIYDRFTESASGEALLNTTLFPNPSTALATQLQSGAVYFDGFNANAANGGGRVPLYAPSPWDSGSSYSHLAESFNNTPNALMTYSLARAEVIHTPGTIALGVLRDLGWTQTSGQHNVAVTKSGSGAGNVTSTPSGIDCGSSCVAAFASGSVITLTANASSGSEFSGWSGQGCAGTATCTLSLDGPKTVVATFNATHYSLAVVRSGSGSGTVVSTPSGIDCGLSCSGAFPAGSGLTLVATAAPGSIFTGWSGAGCTGTGSCTITMNSAKSVTAVFVASGSTADFLQNGDFEAGHLAWVETPLPVILNLASVAHSGSWYARLGGGNSVSDNLYQDVSVPAGIQRARIRFWYRITTSETTATSSYDRMLVTVRDPATGGTLATLATLSNLSATSGWVQSPEYDISAFRGRNLRLHFAATTDSTLSTSFRVDDVQLLGDVTAQTLSVTKAGSGSGTIASSPGGINCGATCSGSFISGSSVTLTAIPAAGSTFQGWSGGGCSGTSTCVVALTAATSVTATFGLQDVSLSVFKAGSGSGTVASSPVGINCGSVCSTVFSPGTVVTLTAAPLTGSTFAGWSGGCSGTGTCVVTLNAATTVTATFTPQQFTLTVAKSGTGIGSVTSSPGGISCGSTCSTSYNFGTSVSLTATAAAGSAFVGWNGGGCSGTGSCVVTLNANTSVTATFIQQQYALTVARSGAGTGTVTSSPSGINCGSTCSASYSSGTSLTLTATPAAGSAFTGWSGGGCSGTGTCVVTLNAATTVTATFTPQQFTLTVAKSGTGIGSVTSSPSGISCGSTCSASYSSGTIVTLTATAAAGSTFKGWSSGCSGTGSCTVVLGASVGVTATFDPKPGVLTLSRQSVDFGSQSILTTAPRQMLTLSNTGGSAITIHSLSASSQDFTLHHECLSLLAPAAECSATLAFTPRSQGPLTAALNVVTSAGTATVQLAGTGERSLVTHYYRSILRRAPDTGGKAFWEAEAARLSGLGVNVNEAWFAMAMSFYNSSEYLAFGRSATEFVVDLYTTFFNRGPDDAGLSYWAGQLASGMPREVALVSFMFSREFASFARAIFGSQNVRAEVDTVVDFYRGLLQRLPDSAGFNHWVNQFRAAQCQGAGAVQAQAEAISSAYANSTEYISKGRTHAQYVGDLYNAFLRRGGDLAGVQFWIDQLAGGAKTRDQVRRDFAASPEFNARVTAIVAQGCMS